MATNDTGEADEINVEKVRAVAKAWTESGKTKFQLLPKSEDETKLNFQCGNMSFFVVCPLRKEDNWHIWTENDETLAALNEVIQQLTSSQRKPLIAVLESVQKALQKTVDDHDQEDDDDDDDEDDDDGFDEDDFAPYYGDEDADAIHDNTVPSSTTIEDDSAMRRYAGQGSAIAVQRLQKDLRNMHEANGKFGVIGTPRDDDLFIWDVQLTGFEDNTRLGHDLREYANRYNRPVAVLLEMTFPQDYPMSPPFVRVVRPRFKFLTGHVTIGGSICMEMLTRSGWRPTNDIEGILVQVRSEIMSDKNARLDNNPDTPYDKAEAERAFMRMVQRYGWNN